MAAFLILFVDVTLTFYMWNPQIYHGMFCFVSAQKPFISSRFSSSSIISVSHLYMTMVWAHSDVFWCYWPLTLSITPPPIPLRSQPHSLSAFLCSSVPLPSQPTPAPGVWSVLMGSWAKAPSSFPLPQQSLTAWHAQGWDFMSPSSHHVSRSVQTVWVVGRGSQESKVCCDGTERQLNRNHLKNF